MLYAIESLARLPFLVQLFALLCKNIKSNDDVLHRFHCIFIYLIYFLLSLSLLLTMLLLFLIKYLFLHIPHYASLINVYLPIYTIYID